MIKMSPRIGPFQLYCILLQAQFGSAIISITHATNDKAGTSAWISCLIGGVINNLFIYLTWKLATKAPTSNVFQMLSKQLGGFFGIIFLGLLAIFYATVAYVILTNWIQTTDLWAYEKTPNWFLLIIMIALSISLISKPISVYARFAVFTTFCAPVFILFEAYSLKDWNTYNILPLIDVGPLQLFDGSIIVLWALMGIEILLVLPRYLQHIEAKKVLRIAIYSNATTMLLYTFTIISSMVLFGSEMISYVREPLLYQMKAVSFNVIERIDLIIISIWILFVITSFSSYLLLFVSSVSAMLKIKKEAPLTLSIICGLLLLICSLWDLTSIQIDTLHDYIYYLAAGSLLCLSLVLLLILKAIKLIKQPGG